MTNPKLYGLYDILLANRENIFYCTNTLAYYTIAKLSGRHDIQHNDIQQNDTQHNTK